MTREDQHFRLRLPADLRALVEKAAEENRRSMTAEILARLEESFSTHQPSLAAPSSLKGAKPENTLYILLDTNGMPISWQEALTHLSEINKSGKLKIHSQTARILASEHVSSTGREDDDLALFIKYRKLNERRLSKTALKFLEEYEAQRASEGAQQDDGES